MARFYDVMQLDLTRLDLASQYYSFLCVSPQRRIQTIAKQIRAATVENQLD